MRFVNTLLLSLVITGCQSPPSAWDGQVHQWGTMREVLAMGKSQARVELSEVTHRSGAYGLGAIAELEGEITIIDGSPIIGRVAEDGKSIRVSHTPLEAATLLAVSYVDEWTGFVWTDPVTAMELDAAILRSAKTAGLNTDDPFPFLLIGKMNVAGHVINGSCPHAAASGSATQREPAQFKLQDQQGMAVGFYAPKSIGSLVHHGSKSHIHVVIEGENPVTGHADSLSMPEGAILRLPVVSDSK